MSLMPLQRISWATLAIYGCKCLGSSLERGEVVFPTIGPCPEPASRREWAVSLLVKPFCGKVPVTFKGALHLFIFPSWHTGLHRVISGSQSLFLWLGIMRCTKAWRGERWQRGPAGGRKLRNAFNYCKSLRWNLLALFLPTLGHFWACI